MKAPTQPIALILFALTALMLSACSSAQARLPMHVRAHAAAPGQGCQINNLKTPARDALAQVLQNSPSCPSDVFGFREQLQQRGARLQTTLVGNRGFHNAGEGSFSLFETVSGPVQGVDFTLAPGNFFFGHFTAADGDKLVNQQAPEKGALMIELIAWDPGKRMYNFYELVGNGQRGEWFYRGDSLDIRADIGELHRQANPAQPRFGRRLRCSGCHLAGGPIMKELAQPHNDWWIKARPLPLAGRQPDAKLAAMMNRLEDAELLAQHVRAGMMQLQAEAPFARAEDLQARLRPLFCPQEVNFESDSRPLDSSAEVGLPAAVLVDPRLAGGGPLLASGQDYASALRAVNSRFPEIERPDGDHAWLAPVKAWADQQEVEGLIREGIVDKEFVSDVLAVDFTRPVVSPQRCGLLSLLPKAAAPGWQQHFAANLSKSSLPAAKLLSQHLSAPNLPAHQDRARRFLSACSQKMRTPAGVRDLLGWTGLQRQAIAKSEISANPLGQILEPGFRVIFPVMQLPAAQSNLNDRCELG